ncbi:MAG: carboxypeptidase-like regulatory domain-containing protein [Aigarchaeota archaeon]|nr:carboxypeptidase-like regulatory domain-containing protein [Candidatus Pelearchaeum maunauluense]
MSQAQTRASRNTTALLVATALVLALPLALFAAQPAEAQESLWLKLVTNAWKGTDCPPATGSRLTGVPACAPTTGGFADRYNATNTFVELYFNLRLSPGAPPPAESVGPFYPNATGFVQIPWQTRYNTYDNLTIFVKAKSFQGNDIGAGKPFNGIIVYALFVTNDNDTVKKITGIEGVAGQYNVTVNDDGLVDTHKTASAGGTGSNFGKDFGLRGGRGSTDNMTTGPVDILTSMGGKGKFALKWFAGNFSKPVDAWIARTAYLFKVFHVHSWYNVKDNVTYAQIFVYDNDHTSGGSPDSTLVAVTTRSDGQARYTREVYPTAALDYLGFNDNKLVPIPLQTINLNNRTAYHGGIIDPNARTTGIAERNQVGAAKLNATVRVWWETVLVNQTLYAGKEYNGTPNYFDLTNVNNMNKKRPLFGGSFPPSGTTSTAGPLSMVYNNTVNPGTPPKKGIFVNGTTIPETKNVASFLNATVFAFRCAVHDKDLAIHNPGGKDNMQGALCEVNLVGYDNITQYYLTRQLGQTNEDGITTEGHSYGGQLKPLDTFLRVPNATWGYRGALNASYYYDPRDARNFGDINKDPRVVVDIGYVWTRTLADDKAPYSGLAIQIKWKGGVNNAYGGAWVVVNMTRIYNPYDIALKKGSDPTPNPNNVGTLTTEGDDPSLAWIGSGGLIQRGTHPEVKEFHPNATAYPSPLKGLLQDIEDIKQIVDPLTPKEFKVGGVRFGIDGLLNITANVFDIAIRATDDLGVILDDASTDVLLRQTGKSIPLEFVTDPTTNASGYWVAFQMPGERGYGVVVMYEGTEVYRNEAEIPKLVKTVFIEVKARVFQIKLLFVDCEGRPLGDSIVSYIHTTVGPVQGLTDTTGVIDLGRMPKGSLTFRSLYWKGVDVPFIKATWPNGTEVKPAADGTIQLKIDKSWSSPIVLTALINDIVFSTWDFDGEVAIPRLNITIWWEGYNISDPTKSAWTFLETMDPGKYATPIPPPIPVKNPAGFDDSDPYNTSVRVAQFFRYVIQYFKDGNEYIFYQMPTAKLGDAGVEAVEYNIVVTTVPDDRWGLAAAAAAFLTPGSNMWPGTGKPVPWESKIIWKPTAKSVTPTEAHGSGIDDRVVLRTSTSLLTEACGVQSVRLNTWAHDFSKRLVDGEETRLGDANYKIKNDNLQTMEIITTSWTEDNLDVTAINKDDPLDSKIWWNGSYVARDLVFAAYFYPFKEPSGGYIKDPGLVELIDGNDALLGDGPAWPFKNIFGETVPSVTIDQFFNNTPDFTKGAWNNTWPEHNFTVIGSQELWDQTKWRWEKAVSDRRVPAVPSREQTLVFEDELLKIPLPVGFITLDLRDQDGKDPLPYAVVQLSIFHDNQFGPGVTATEFLRVRWKTGIEGNLTLLLPIAGMMNETLDTKGVTAGGLINYTLTVFWYLNSGIVYKDAFNLTKRGYSVGNVAVADTTFVLAISADKERAVKDLYAKIWWFNVSAYIKNKVTQAVHPGQLVVDHEGRTWKLTELDETKGGAAWADGKVTVNLVPTSKRFTVSDWTLEYDSTTRRYEYKEVTRTFDIPYPSDKNGAPLDGWPYVPAPNDYVRVLTYAEDWAIQYRVSVWHPDLAIPPTDASYGAGAWEGTLYELVWRASWEFRFAWMLFGDEPFDISFWRGTSGRGDFKPLPGYALTRTWVAEPEPGAKTVAIKLNAADVEIPVYWQVGDSDLGTYDCGPLYGYMVKGRIIQPEGSTLPNIIIDTTAQSPRVQAGVEVHDVCSVFKEDGKVWLVKYVSGNTPDTVVWGGATLRIDEVSPPPEIWADSSDPVKGKGTWSNYWKTWVGSAEDPITKKKVSEELKEGNQLDIPGVDLGIQYMGYGVPYYGVSFVATVQVVSNDPDTREHRPFVATFVFQNVSARITDFNGRPLPGSFFQLIDAQTGKSAGWSYAGPDGQIVPIPIRKPGGTFILRVFYLGYKEDGVPTWPVNSFARWPVVYDSREDEVEVRAQKPDVPLGFQYVDEGGPVWTGAGWAEVCEELIDIQDGAFIYSYSASILDAESRCPPSGWGRSFDIITRVFDLRIRFVYGDAQKPADPYFVFSSPSLALPDDFKIDGQAPVFKASRLVRGTYEVTAYWPGKGGVEVGKRTFDISEANVGTVEGTVQLALRDVSFLVVDRQGRPLSQPQVKVSPSEVIRELPDRPENPVTIIAMPDGITYTLEISWTSPDFGTKATAVVRESPKGLAEKGVVVVPVDDVQLKVVDLEGRAVAGSAVSLGGKEVGRTDSQGIVVVGNVPLDNEYTVTVVKDGAKLAEEPVRFTAARLEATVKAGIYDVTVFVKGAAGQPIEGATVRLLRNGVEVAAGATDASGQVAFEKLMIGEYQVEATVPGFSASGTLAREQKSITLTLDLYTVLFGVPMTFATFLALIIGLILLVIVIVVVISEYIRWRGRRLGIYPPAPPKK